MMIIMMGISLVYSQNRIMLIGNSITQGKYSSNGLGFRDDIYNKLNQISYPFVFVGSSGGHPYRGHFLAGAYIPWFYSGVGGTGSFDVQYDMNFYGPRIVVVHLGTNDITIPNRHKELVPYRDPGNPVFLTTTTGCLAQFIAYLLEWKNGTRWNGLRDIFVCKIIERRDYENKVALFNDELEMIHQDSEDGLLPQIPPGSFKLIDQYASFDTTTMWYFDGIHPNDNGYQHMANVFFDSLRTLPMVLTQVSEDSQRGGINQKLQDSLVVRILNHYGEGVEGIKVVYKVTDGSAVIPGDSIATTDSLGFAHTQVQLSSTGHSVVIAKSSDLIPSEVAFFIEAVEYLHVAGTVLYHANQKPIPQVEVEWKEAQGHIETTDHAGQFNHDQVLFGDTVTLLLSKGDETNPSISRITSYDAALVAQNVIGLDRFDSMDQMVGDVDLDNKITLMDAVYIGRYCVEHANPTQVSIGKWIILPDSLYYNAVYQNYDNQSFTGILIGDVSGDWNDPNAIPKLFSSHTPSRFHFKHTNQIFRIPFRFQGEDLLSADFVCIYDPYTLTFQRVSQNDKYEQMQINWLEKVKGVVRIGMFRNRHQGDSLSFDLEFLNHGVSNTTSIHLQNFLINEDYQKDLSLELQFDERPIQSPQQFALLPNYPNPFNDKTVFRYTIPEYSMIKLMIYNNRGQWLVTLMNQYQIPGEHQVKWDGKDFNGCSVPSGVYFYVLKTDVDYLVRKMEIVK